MKETKETIDSADNPPITEERAKKGWVRLPDGSRIVPVKMDAAAFHWFQSQGKDFSEQIEALLGTYAETQHKHQSA